MNRLVEDELDRLEAENNKRMNVIAQNGNEGLHYIKYELDGEITEIEVNEPIVVEPTDKAKLRKDTPVFSGVLKYFPNALKAVARALRQVMTNITQTNLALGYEQSKDEYDAMIRTLLDHEENPVDDDNILHLTKVAWRALAGLERYLTNNH